MNEETRNEVIRQTSGRFPITMEMRLENCYGWIRKLGNERLTWENNILNANNPASLYFASSMLKQMEKLHEDNITSYFMLLYYRDAEQNGVAYRYSEEEAEDDIIVEE